MSAAPNPLPQPRSYLHLVKPHWYQTDLLGNESFQVCTPADFAFRLRQAMPGSILLNTGSEPVVFQPLIYTKRRIFSGLLGDRVAQLSPLDEAYALWLIKPNFKHQHRRVWTAYHKLDHNYLP